MELKFCNCKIRHYRLESSNRTFMELKLAIIFFGCTNKQGSNRTFMELK